MDIMEAQCFTLSCASVDLSIWHFECYSSDCMQFCSYVVVKLRKGFLLVLSFLCLQQQWY